MKRMYYLLNGNLTYLGLIRMCMSYFFAACQNLPEMLELVHRPKYTLSAFRSMNPLLSAGRILTYYRARATAASVSNSMNSKGEMHRLPTF